MGGTAVLIIKVVGVLPDIERKQRPETAHNWVRSARLLRNHE